MGENSAKKGRKSRRGRPPTHGGFSLLVRGELPKNRQYIGRYLTDIRMGLIADLGPTEEDLTAAQMVLIDRVVTKLGVIRCIEEHLRERGVMAGNMLAPALRASYLAYNNSVRLDLQALGINTRKGEEALDLDKYIEKKYGKKGKKDG